MAGNSVVCGLWQYGNEQMSPNCHLRNPSSLNYQIANLVRLNKVVPILRPTPKLDWQVWLILRKHENGFAKRHRINAVWSPNHTSCKCCIEIANELKWRWFDTYLNCNQGPCRIKQIALNLNQGPCRIKQIANLVKLINVVPMLQPTPKAIAQLWHFLHNLV